MIAETHELCAFCVLHARKEGLLDMYGLVLTLHNAFAGLTLLLTLVASLVLLFTARTSSTGSALALRADVISASIQGLLGILLIVLNTGNLRQMWLHIVFGLISVGVVSAFAGRARRSPDSEARRYGGILLAIAVLVLLTFLIGQIRYNPL